MIEIAVLGGIAALVVAVYLTVRINREPLGTEKMREVYEAIREGSKAYLTRQYKTIGIISAILTVALYLAFDFPVSRLPVTSFSFILGAACFPPSCNYGYAVCGGDGSWFGRLWTNSG